MAFTIQQENRSNELIDKLKAFKTLYYDLIEAKDAAALLAIPGQSDYPAPGNLEHVTRARLQNAHGVVDALKTFMTTGVVLFAGNPAKSPLDAVVEVIR